MVNRSRDTYLSGKTSGRKRQQIEKNLLEDRSRRVTHTGKTCSSTDGFPQAQGAFRHHVRGFGMVEGGALYAPGFCRQFPQPVGIPGVEHLVRANAVAGQTTDSELEENYSIHLLYTDNIPTVVVVPSPFASSYAEIQIRKSPKISQY